ncbi:MAG: RNA polymerase sigma factor [Chloroflexota bacterium]
MNEPEPAPVGGTPLRSVDDPDLRLMERLAAGDAEALDGLFERYGAMAYSVALRITGDPAAAEDVVQDAFLGAWRNADRFVGSRGLARTWLLSIVHHRAIDAIRRRRPATELPDPEAPTPDALTMPDVWGEVARGLDRTAILAALETISAVQREALELAFFSGLTQVEVATRTGTPLGTVKSRMRLGLLGLRRALIEPEPAVDAPRPREVERD